MILTRLLLYVRITIERVIMKIIKSNKETNPTVVDDWTALKKQYKNVVARYKGFAGSYRKFVNAWYSVPSFLKKSVVLYEDEEKTYKLLVCLYDSLFDLSNIKHGLEVVHDTSINSDRIKKFESKMSELYAKIEPIVNDFRFYASNKFDKVESVSDIIRAAYDYLIGEKPFEQVVDSRQNYADSHIKTL